MPIKGDDAEALTLPRVDPTEERKDEDRGKKKQSHYDVGRVKSDQGVERRAKEVCADGQSVMIDQLLPFNRRTCKEDCRKCDGGAQPNGEASDAVIFDSFLRAPDREDCWTSRQIVARIGTSNTCAGVGPERLLPI